MAQYISHLQTSRKPMIQLGGKHYTIFSLSQEYPGKYRVLMGKQEGKRPLGRPRRRWEDGIRMDLREIGWGSVDWMQLAQDRDRWRALVNTVMNLRVLAPRSWLVS
jgi:hypothetical protein